jgi:hypothetical protein
MHRPHQYMHRPTEGCWHQKDRQGAMEGSVGYRGHRLHAPQAAGPGRCKQTPDPWRRISYL